MLAVVEQHGQRTCAAWLDDQLQVMEGEGHSIEQLVVGGSEAAFHAALVDFERQDARLGRQQGVGDGAKAGLVGDDPSGGERADEIVMAGWLGGPDFGRGRERLERNGDA